MPAGSDHADMDSANAKHCHRKRSDLARSLVTVDDLDRFGVELSYLGYLEGVTVE